MHTQYLKWSLNKLSIEVVLNNVIIDFHSPDINAISIILKEFIISFEN